MKYLIDGKSAYLIAEQNGISRANFYCRMNHNWAIEDAVSKPTTRKTWHKSKYIIKKDGETKFVCYSTVQVANYLGTSKGTICGLFFRHGNKIQLFGYTIKRT